MPDVGTFFRVEFHERPNGPERLVADAALVFTGGILDGLRLEGFALWRSAEDEVYVTVPSRPCGMGGERRYFDYVRGDSGAVKRLRQWVLGEYRDATAEMVRS